MIVRPIIFDNILFGDLAPWYVDSSSEIRFRDILSNQVRINKDDPPLFFKALSASLDAHGIHVEIDHLPTANQIADLAKFADLQNQFSILTLQPHFNKASAFYRYLITNESIRILSAIVSNVFSSKTIVDAQYQVTSLLNNLEYSIEHFAQKQCSDTVGSYVLNSVKIQLFRVYEQIKAMFPKYTPAEALSSEELLHQLFPTFDQDKSVPSTTSFIINNYLINKQIIKPVEIITLHEQQSAFETTLHSFTYIHLAKQPEYINDLLENLKSHNFVPKNTSPSDFKKIFSGEPVTKPIAWSGTISELNYFIKLIHNINESVKNLRQQHWEVACKCFVYPDGRPFDRAQLKEQKKPKSSADLLVKAARQLL